MTDQPGPFDRHPADGAPRNDVVSDFTARRLVGLYADLGRRITAHASTADALAAITDVAVEALPGAHHVSVTRHRDDRHQTLAPTDVIATGADQLQYELNSGPCVDAVRADGPLMSADIAGDPRWPVFGPQVAERFGIASMLSIPMVLDDDINASLNLYSDVVGALTDSQTLAMLLTTHGAAAVSHVIARERAVNLEKALVNSRRIGMAIGVLMSARKLTHEQAFDLMKIVSQNSNRRMSLVADEVIETGTLTMPNNT